MKPHLAAPPSQHRRGARPTTGGHRPTVPMYAAAAQLPVHTLDPATVMILQRSAGNLAVSALLEGRAAGPGWPPVRAPVQREVGWKSDASHQGHGWNVEEHPVGRIRRIPLEGLKQGLQDDAMIESLSSESAKGRAIVLVPEALNPKQPVEVLIHLHGYTEKAGRPFAGWRELDTEAAKQGNRMRQGVDEGDVAPVRDVALDQAEQQLDESGYVQQVIVLPQGGLRSQFGKAGDYNFDAGAYVGEIVARLVSEGVWKTAPSVGRLSMAGHSGAGATLANMARESVRRQAGKKPGKSSALTGDLVLFDAINGNELAAFQSWVEMRLNQDLAALNAAASDADRFAYLQTAPKLRGYYATVDGNYVGRYRALNRTIRNWFRDHAPQLGAFAPCLKANFTIVGVPVVHEELMRGVRAGQARGGKGGILDALHSLHPPRATACPAVPAGGGAAAPAPAGRPPRERTAAAKRAGASSSAAGGVATPARGPSPAAAEHHASKHAPGGESRAQQIATAILLAKTAGVGHGKTAEEKAASKAEAEKQVADDILAGTKQGVDEWFARFEPDATFLGKTIRASSKGEPPGVHHELALKLKMAEDMLLEEGETPTQARQRLQVKDVAGLRVPKTPTGKSHGASMHCFGLAVDIDHDDNPFVGNEDKVEKKGPAGGPSIQIIEHATLLLGGAMQEMRQPAALSGSHDTDSEVDRQARAERAVRQWERLAADSEHVRRYLSMTPDELAAVVKDQLPALTAWREAHLAPPAPPSKQGKKKKQKKAPEPPPWIEHVSDPDWWQAQHQRDIKQSRSGDFGYGANPREHGFMTLREELVRALVMAGLTWGGVYNTDKDLMHFDLRTGSIGGRPVV